MTCTKPLSIFIKESYPWSTLVWDQLDGYAGLNGGFFNSQNVGTSGWAGDAKGGDIETSCAAGHAIGIYNGPLLNCVVIFNLINPPANPGFGASFNILQNGSSRIGKSFVAGTIVPGVNIYAFTLLNTSGANQSIEVQGGQSIGPPASKSRVFVAAVSPTFTSATIQVGLP